MYLNLFWNTDIIYLADMDVTIKELVIIDYINQCVNRDDSIKIEQDYDTFVYLPNKDILEHCSILHIGLRALQETLRQLKRKRLINTITTHIAGKGTLVYYSVRADIADALNIHSVYIDEDCCENEDGDIILSRMEGIE